MITPELLDALQEQMNVERQNAALYKAMSLTLQSLNWPGCAKWMDRAAAEEQGHADQFAQHIIDRAGPNDEYKPEYETLPAPVFAIADTPLLYFTEAYRAEVLNTERLIALMQNADEAGDEQLMEFLRPFIREQTNSEHELTDMIIELRRAEANIAALLVLDERYGK